MFTGVITHIGRVAAIKDEGDRVFAVESTLDLDAIDIGASVCHSGVCLTVIEKQGQTHKVQASAETLDLTTARDWRTGTPVNLETSLRLGDELGGHLVFGHVDGKGRITRIEETGEAHRLEIEIPEKLLGLVAFKGSIAIDGISLTVNEVSGNRIALMIIPHSWQMTTLGTRKKGDEVNVEADMLARYVQRHLQLTDVSRLQSTDVSRSNS